jgi:hypothetical protein
MSQLRCNSPQDDDDDDDIIILTANGFLLGNGGATLRHSTQI